MSIPPQQAPEATLLVDDDAFVRKVLARQLDALDAGTVLTAAGGGEARALLRSGTKLRLVVMDLQMPGLDGVELLRDIAEHHPAAALVLVSSADARVLRTARDVARSRRLHVAGAFRKPVSLEDLRGVMQSLDRAPQVRPAAPTEAEVSLAELQAALEAGEIGIHVQPEVDLRTGATLAVEVLVRWHSPSRGTVRPDRFIGLAESGGLIQPLTDRVMELALRAATEWADHGLRPHLAVNLSSHCLGDLQLPDRITALAQAVDLEPGRLVLEITESGIAGNSAQSLDVLARLRLRGFELSIDDFGTGYSSLQQLQRIPFSQLKIDRSFVDRAADEADARHIVEANIRLARGLGLRTVAEGVETTAQLAVLKTLECDLVQGYLLGRPMPPEQLLHWIANFRLP